MDTKISRNPPKVYTRFRFICLHPEPDPQRIQVRTCSKLPEPGQRVRMLQKRQRKPKNRPLPRHTLHPNLPAMRPHQAQRHRQAQPCAANQALISAVRAPKTLKTRGKSPGAMAKPVYVLSKSRKRLVSLFCQVYQSHNDPYNL